MEKKYYCIKLIFQMEIAYDELIKGMLDEEYCEGLTFYEESLRLVSAKSSDKAYQKVRSQVKKELKDSDYINKYGQTVTTKLVDMIDCFELFDPPASGVEVYSRISSAPSSLSPADYIKQKYNYDINDDCENDKIWEQQGIDSNLGLNIDFQRNYMVKNGKLIEIAKGDITNENTDAIVNAADTSLLGGGGVDGAIHRAAGPELLDECRLLNGCKIGEAKITKGYNLKAKYVVHTSGPNWNGGNSNEDALLADCYKNSLLLADKNDCESISFPSISTGICSFPLEKASVIAINTIFDTLQQCENLFYVRMVCFDAETYKAYNSAFHALKKREYGNKGKKEYVDGRKWITMYL